ncbi:branched-chain amino acid ABC transporter permease [Thioclava litoralis]|uniref:Branched-chain amino acid ABC transporter permease n=1 Tax=Thioclava litoralis TaxID=3076557 RepID=A0ABZ1E0C0_9RHOB|nr:branched-chain amino acid ABC transporter permease [Thioclava sp. FTW29]
MEALNALVAFANYVFIPALSYGSQLALGALGVTLVYSILRFSNFAHGDMMAFGTGVTILVTWLLQDAGLGLGPLPTALLALPIGIVVTAALALVTDRLVYAHYRKIRATPVVLVMVSVGVMFVMNALTRIMISVLSVPVLGAKEAVSGVDEIRFADGERFLVSARAFKNWSGLSEPLAIRASSAITFVTAILVMIALFWFLNRTRAGKSMRAFSDNEDLALLSGIDPKRVVMITWIITAALATIAGTLYGLDKSFKAFNYFQLLLPIFAATILGGIGNPIGAIVGGYIIAFSEVGVTYAWKKIATYLIPGWEPSGLVQLLSTDYKFAVSFTILIAVLIFRPTGLFKGKSI